MMKKTGLRFMVSYFLIFLVLTIPFLSSNALAAIEVRRVSGQGLVEDYRLSDDSTRIDFTSDSNNVRLAEQPFTEIPCSIRDDERYDCVFNSFRSLITNNSQTNTLVLYNIDIGQIPGTETSAVVYIDNLPPAITSWDVNLSESKENLLFSWDIIDKANNNDMKCAGIKKVEFVDDDTSEVLAQYEISSIYPDCRNVGNEPRTNIVPAGSSQEKRICIIAYDNLFSESSGERLSHRTKICKDILIDRENPLVNCPYNVTKDGREIKYIATRGYSSFIDGAKISLTIKEDELISVQSDLSELSQNPFFADLYRNIEWPSASSQALICGNQTNTWTCEWNNIHFEPSTSDPSIRLMMSDNSGQTFETSCSAHFEIDNVAPILSSVGTNKTRAGRSFVNNATNEIIAIFEESGAGFTQGRVFFILNSLNQEYSGLVIPNNCEKISDEQWQCNVFARVTNTEEGAVLGINVPDTFDDAGNALSNGFGSVVLDVNPPSVINFTRSTECAVYGEKLELKYNLLDLTSGLKSMIVDPSHVSVYPYNITGDCQDKNNGVYECSAEIDYILTHAGTNLPIDIYFEDIAGNVNHVVLPQDTCVSDDDITPSFVTVRVKTPVPSQIDRRLASINDLPFMIMIPLEFNTHGARIMRIQDDNCLAIRDHIDFEQPPYLYDEYGQNTTLVIKLRLDEDAVAQDFLNISCNLSMRIQSGSRVFMEPEIEEIKINIPFYEWPLGYPDSHSQVKISEAKKEIRRLDEKIGKIQKWVDFLDTLFGIIRALGTINSGLQLTKSVIYGICMALEAAFGIGEGIWKASCPPLDFFHGFISKYIWPAGMVPSGGMLPGYFFKWATLLYECGLCKFDNYLSFGLEQYKNHQLEQSPLIGVNDRFGAGSTYRAYAQNSKLGQSVGRTQFVNEINAEGWIFEPYKGIQYSYWCLCLPGILYNFKKLKQINCRYLSCLQDHSRNGLSIDNCDIMKDEMTCLYWDSAQYKLHGIISTFFQNLLMFIWKNLPGLLFGAAYTLFCKNYFIYGKDIENCDSLVSKGWKSALCGITGAALGIMEMNEMLSNGWSQFWSSYDDNLAANDMCQGVDYSE